MRKEKMECVAKKLEDVFSKEELHHLMWKKPSFAQIELTRNCNQSCIFCFANCKAGVKEKDSSLEKWKQTVDKLEKLGVSKIHYTGGENFLYPYFTEILQYTKEKGFCVQVNTNGTIAIDKTLPFVDEYVFSVHGLGEVHNAIVKKENAFALVEKNIKKAAEAKKIIHINMVLVKSNFDHFEKVYEYFASRYPIKSFSPTFAAISNNGTHFEEERIPIHRENIEKYFEGLKKIGKENLTLKHGLYALFEYEPSLIERKYPIELPICAAGKDKLIIKYDGSVYPCNFFLNKDYYCGNIFTEDEQEIWQKGKGFAPFREMILEEKIPEKCKACQNKRCFSGCRVWTKNYIEGGKKIDYERDIRCEIAHAFVGNGDYKSM